MSSGDYDSTYGMFFYGEWSTDGDLGEGAYAAGDRITSPFQLGVLSEALDQAYRVTGREDLREIMVAMAEFVDEIRARRDVPVHRQQLRDRRRAALSQLRRERAG